MNEQTRQRTVKHRLSVLRHAAEVTGNVAATCRYYGMSRPTVIGCSSSDVSAAVVRRSVASLGTQVAPCPTAAHEPRSWRS
jgi:hypothetical protein